MAAAISSPLPDDLLQPLGLLQLLLDTSLTGVMLLAPRYNAAEETIIALPGCRSTPPPSVS